MARILAIDYGSKRVGIAVTDPLKIIATALTTIHSKDVIPFLKTYIEKENVESIVVGEPKTLDNKSSDSARFIDPFVTHLKRTFPLINTVRFDERFTSKLALNSMIESGASKKQRQNKSNIDVISAVILLQDYLTYLNTQK
ncbi:MAG: Holliday junction resolvase RuvX [Bacteroidetes bacterium]|nr:Holliday junction resolvase RuvX [Bacteroidota bacterium]